MRILNYLLLDSFVLVLLCLAIFCMYYAITIKGKSKIVNIFFVCLSVASIIMAIERLSAFTDVFEQYLSVIQPINWALFCITMILLFFIRSRKY